MEVGRRWSKGVSIMIIVPMIGAGFLLVAVGILTMWFFSKSGSEDTSSAATSVPLSTGGVHLTEATGIVLDAGTEHLPLHGHYLCLLYTSPSPRDRQKSRMPSSA